MKKVFVTSLILGTFLVFAFGNLYAAEELALISWTDYAPKSLVDKFQKETGKRCHGSEYNFECLLLWIFCAVKPDSGQLQDRSSSQRTTCILAANFRDLVWKTHCCTCPARTI